MNGVESSFEDLLLAGAQRAEAQAAGLRPASDQRPVPRLQGLVLLLLLFFGSVFTTTALVWNASNATFNSATTNSGNSWSAGTVAVGDDDSSTAMFALTNLIPGSTGSKCIVVTYSGTVAASVKLYRTAASYTGTLGSYLDLTIEQGTGGSFAGGCGAFISAATLYTGTLAGFSSSATSFASGLGTFTPTGTGQVSVYKFTYTLQDDNSAQGLSGGIGLTWEARNT
jgi:hypothetical protein